MVFSGIWSGILSGTLAEIGRGRTHADAMKEILNSCDRKRAGRTAPPNGLFLERIVY